MFLSILYLLSSVLNGMLAGIRFDEGGALAGCVYAALAFLWGAIGMAHARLEARRDR